MDLEQLFRDSIINLSSLFKPDQLAYYSLTSKPEHQIRDAIAYQMHTSITDKNMSVCRELQRADLAILKNQNLIFVAEFKCAYTFDCTDNNSNGPKFGHFIINDIKKSVEYAESDTKIYACLLLIHPKSKISYAYSRVAKYYNQIYKTYSRISPDEVLVQAKTNITKYFMRWGITPEINTINCGKEFSVDVDLLTFVIGPLTKEQIISSIITNTK